VGEEAWLLDHIIVDGDTARPEVWADLSDALQDAGVHVAAIDAGFNTSMVYAFVEKRRWAMAVKGVTGLHRPLIEDQKRRLQRLRQRRKRGQPVEPLGVDQGKALIYARAKLMTPGPGYIHFKRDAAFDDEYFAQLAAEKLVTKIKGTRPFQEWVQTRPRNEALDCLVYALAACRLSGRALVVVPKVGAGDTLPPLPVIRRIGRIGGFK
ncbi:MAG: phage terminase large subunit family protein, partial [Proteobacteria bacterium]|nr:phage terminase large subunit family protein [Pseudomonadota bacterium]